MARKGKKPQSGTPKQAAPKATQSAGDQLKEKLKNVNKGSLLGMLSQVQKTTPDQWKDADSVRDMAKKFAQTLKIPVSEERLDAFMKAYKDATKGGKPNANVEDLVNKYGKGKVDDATVKEMKKLLKPKD